MDSVNNKRKFGISSFALHITAMLLMLCDHLWGTFLMHIDFLADLGRITFPLFAFMLAEGFARTKSRKKYTLRIFLFALISEIPFNLVMGRNAFYILHQNVLFTFLLAIGLFCIYEQIKKCRHLAARLPLYAAATIVFYALGFITFADYYGHGILIAALFYFTKWDEATPVYSRILRAVIQLAALYYISCEMIQGIVIPINLLGFEFEVHRQAFSLLSLPLIWLYNGRQGPYNKWVRVLYYGFYPAHLLILGLIITLI